MLPAFADISIAPSFVETPVDHTDSPVLRSPPKQQQD